MWGYSEGITVIGSEARVGECVERRRRWHRTLIGMIMGRKVRPHAETKHGESADVGCERLHAHVINACQGLTADGQGLPDMMTDRNAEMRSRHISKKPCVWYINGIHHVSQLWVHRRR